MELRFDIFSSATYTSETRTSASFCLRLLIEHKFEEVRCNELFDGYTYIQGKNIKYSAFRNGIIL